VGSLSRPSTDVSRIHLRPALSSPDAGQAKDKCADNVAWRLHAEVLSFCEWIAPTAEEHQLRTLVIAWVKLVVQSVITDAEIHPFGSFTTKLYLPAGCVFFLPRLSFSFYTLSGARLGPVFLTLSYPKPEISI
jgi:DNA polymerase sigma